MVYARADALMRRALEGARRGLAALLAEAMSPQELTALSVRMYGVLLPPSSREQGLWDWEERWFAARLPAPPARLLVGGAGAGREVVELVKRGYAVDAFEPAPELLPALARSGAGRAVRARHEDLAQAVLDGENGEAAAFRGERYDAVLLGWGSFTHVMGAADRGRTLAACARLTDGPILASFWLNDQWARKDAAGRAAALGRVVGRRLGQLRGTPPPVEAFAFGHAFERGELERLAAGVGRRLAWDAGAGEYPHATFLAERRAGERGAAQEAGRGAGLG